MTANNDTPVSFYRIAPERTTFRALLSEHDFATLDLFELDRYGDGIDGIENGESIPYRYLDPVSESDTANAVGHRSLVGGDYSGGSLIRSNLKAFRAMVEAETGDGSPLPIVDYHGGHGTDGVLLLLDREHETEKLRPFVDLLRGLEDYPVVCDDTMSEVEQEDEDEAWDRYAEEEFASELASHIGQDTGIKTLATYGETTLRDLFTAAADSANLNGGPGVIHETEGASFMVTEAAEAVSPVLLFALGFVELDADTMLSLASSTDTDDHDDARRILRLSRLGVGLRQVQNTLAHEISRRTIKRRAIELDGKTLSTEAMDVIQSEAKRQAQEHILTAEIDAGDTSAPIGEQGLNVRQRIATVKLDRFVFGGAKESHTVKAEITIDPAGPYSFDRSILRDFVASF